MTFNKLIAVLILSLFVSACGSTYKEPPPLPPQYGDENVKIGNPYTVDGITYYPREDPYYDVTGVASWYGPDFHGKLTANGEEYDMNALTAAHTTLPLPSYVRVTNLDNGRALVLRVNDRGPFKKNRIIDVSRRAAQLLGFEVTGTARVRVQIVNPDGTPIPKPIDGGLIPVPQRTAEADIETTPLETLPEPEELEGTPDQAGTNGVEMDQGFTIFVQVASFASQDNAESFARYLQTFGPSVIHPTTVNNSLFYRVRMGAFETMEEAVKMLDVIKNLGFGDARIFTQPNG